MDKKRMDSVGMIAQNIGEIEILFSIYRITETKDTGGKPKKTIIFVFLSEILLVDLMSATSSSCRRAILARSRLFTLTRRITQETTLSTPMTSRWRVKNGVREVARKMTTAIVSSRTPMPNGHFPARLGQHDLFPPDAGKEFANGEWSHLCSC